MASSDPTGLYIFGLIILAIIGLFVYSHLNQRRIENKQKELMKAFRASPKFEKDKPAFLHGQATGPDLVLPTTGEHVAYYGLFVMSREMAVTDTRSGISVRVNGISLTGDQSRITSVEGFHFFETSGDFTVTSSGRQFTVQPAGAFAYFHKGADLVSGLVAERFKRAGLPEQFFHDVMDFQVAEQVFRVLFMFEAPVLEERMKRYSGSVTTRNTKHMTSFSVTTAKARIDTRVHTFVSGFNLPQGILDLITKRGIILSEKEEILVVEVYIPLNHDVYAFGTFDGDRDIGFNDPDTRLFVSYEDPESS